MILSNILFLTVYTAANLKEAILNTKKHATSLKGANYAPDKILKTSIVNPTENNAKIVFSFPEGVVNNAVLYINSYKLWQGTSVGEAVSVKDGKLTVPRADFSVFTDKYKVKERNEVVFKMMELVIRQPAPKNYLMYPENIDNNLLNEIKQAAAVKVDGVDTVDSSINYNTFQEVLNNSPNYKKEDSDGLGKQAKKNLNDGYKTIFNALQMETVEFDLSKLGISPDNKIHVLEFVFNTNYLSNVESLAQSEPFCYDGTKYYIKDTSSFTDQSWFKILMAFIAIAVGLGILSFVLREKKQAENEEVEAAETLGKAEVEELKKDDGILETAEIKKNE